MRNFRNFGVYVFCAGALLMVSSAVMESDSFFFGCGWFAMLVGLVVAVAGNSKKKSH